jgi:hypothetical protein
LVSLPLLRRRQAVGNKPIEPGVKLRDQGKGTAAKPSAPEGHTPVESSALKSYKYDADAQELHVTASNGITYVSGEVTPDQASAFAASDSKGLAWKAIRENSPLVAKIINGKRIAMKGPRELRSAGPETEAPSEPMSLSTVLGR